MPPPQLSYGLNLAKKPQPATSKNPTPTSFRPLAQTAGQKRKKAVLNESDSDRELDGDGASKAVEISTIGGIELEATEATEGSSTGSKPRPSQRTSGAAQLTTERKQRSAGLGKLNVLKSSKSSIFADEEEDDNDEETDAGAPAKAKRVTGTSKDYTNLATLHSSKKHAQEAQDLDPSIYSYDAVYDSIHATKDKNGSSGAGGGDAANNVPRYMRNLLRSAEIRKRDQLRARERLLAKEREAEGDEFADKEKFVTAAYKAQQEELRRVEEEEALREEEEEARRRQNGGGGMVGFYRDMLARGEQRHEEIVKAAEHAARGIKEEILNVAALEDSAAAKEKTDAQIAAELNARGAKIILNEEGEVVDKRQLLSAGLNIAPKLKAKPSPAAAASVAGRGGPRGGVAGGVLGSQQSSRAAQRARQTEMIAKQLEERARQEEEAEKERQRELVEKARSRKTQEQVSSARERYLARKREREMAAGENLSKVS